METILGNITSPSQKSCLFKCMLGRIGYMLLNLDLTILEGFDILKITISEVGDVT